MDGQLNLVQFLNVIGNVYRVTTRQ